MKKLFLLGVLLTVLSIRPAISQEFLTLEDALQIGLEQNFGILVAENEAEIDRLNRSLGNAGFLPSLEVRGSREEIFESETSTVEGENSITEDVEVSLLSGDVELGWTLFDGSSMFVRYRKLGELRDLGETLARIQVENTIKDITEAYYEIVRQEKVLDVLENSVEISEERYDIAQTKRELGSGTEFELLLARADLNTDRAAVVRQEVIVNDAKTSLIRLLDLDTDVEFDVSETISVAEELLIDDLYPLFLENNRQLEAARLRTDISQLEVRELRRKRLPQLDLSAGYTYNREEVRNSLLLHERTDGFYVGLTARINLFDGFNTNRQVQTAKIRHRNESIRSEEEKKFLETALFAEYKNYTSALELVDLENENLELAQEAVEIALEQFRLATITSVEMRETQNILFNTENRLIDAQFEAKLSETELLLLSGTLNSVLGQ
ncbi:MAG: TolC family protein [Balneolaceae bacterium]|nr:TolC family protein [Balneolaceae bacterium]